MPLSTFLVVLIAKLGVSFLGGFIQQNSKRFMQKLQIFLITFYTTMGLYLSYICKQHVLQYFFGVRGNSVFDPISLTYTGCPKKKYPDLVDPSDKNIA